MASKIKYDRDLPDYLQEHPVKMVVCDVCKEKVEIDETYRCENCGKVVCSECADEELVADFKAPDDFKQVCKKCAPDPYDNG